MVTLLMKKTIGMKSQISKTAFLICVMLLAFGLGMTAKKPRVERGMTKQQVAAILGQPANTSFDENGETWEYLKSSLISNSTNRIVVCFGRDDRVRACQSSTIDNSTNTLLGYGRRPGDYPMPVAQNPDYYGLDNERFGTLYIKVRDASFDSNRFDLVEVACLGCWFSCSQVASLLRLFTFSDAKFKVLGMVAPRIVDPQNAADIYREFDFSSDRDKAAEILRGR